MSCLNADGGDIAAGERGFCNLAERDDDTLAAVRAALALAERVGCPNVNVLPGLFVDRPHGRASSSPTRWRSTASRWARGCGGRTIVVEPINELDVPGYLPPPPLRSQRSSRVSHPNVRMLFDAYHCARGGGDPIRDVGTFRAAIGHVQYADAPGVALPAR